MKNMYQAIIQSDDPFDVIYNSLNDNSELGRAMTELYSQVSIDFALHPDDDFERIIEIMVDQIEEDFAS
jgi:hypothetical protein